MKKHTLYIGLNDKDTKVQKIDTLEATKIISNLITDKFEGGTIYNATGIYKHDDGQIVIENTLRIELIDADENALKEFVRIAKAILNQESIIIQTETINTFIA